MLRTSVVILCLILVCLSCAVSSLPHCERTEIPKRLVVRNVINVVYTMESSCKICVQQASRLPKLKRYLEKKGIKTHIIIGVSHKADRLSGLVPHIQVNSRHVWRALGEQNNHFYVIDRCGRLVYEVINPWSNLRLSFVKAAVASTAHSHPCGLCPEDYTHVPKVEEIQEFEPMENYDQTPLEDVSLLKLNIRLRHTHRGDPNVYNYIVKVLDRPDYHGHHPLDKPLPLKGTLQRLITTTLPSTSSTGVPRTLQSEEPLDVLSSTRLSNEENKSTTLSSTVQTESSLIISNRISHTTESSSLITNTLQQSTESTTNSIDDLTTNSISYSLSSESQEMASTSEFTTNPININFSSTDISNSQIKIETSTQDLQEESTSRTDESLSERTSPLDYYDDDSSYERVDEITEDEVVEQRNLKAHYRRILDWMNFVRDDDYD